MRLHFPAVNALILLRYDSFWVLCIDFHFVLTVLRRKRKQTGQKQLLTQREKLNLRRHRDFFNLLSQSYDIGSSISEEGGFS